jgi:intracellular multiplication protein IcmC
MADPVPAVSLSSFSVDVMLTNLQASFGSIVTLVKAVSYVMGMFFIVSGVMRYRIFANQTFGSAQRGEIAGPMVFIVIGAILFYLPSTVDTSVLTVFGSTDMGQIGELIAYQSLASSEKWQHIATVIIQYMKLIGLIAFIRGWVILAKMGHPGSQPGSVPKGLIHVIGGVLLINIVDTVNILGCTFGYTGGGCS